MSTPQQKNWQILPKIKENIIKQYPDYSKVVLQLLSNRGMIAAADQQSPQSSSGDFGLAENIERFLNPDYGKYSHDPFLFSQMNEAVELIIKHIKKQNKIVVFGDYDADGVTSSAVLFETLTILKGKVDVYIPDRVSEGYGLNKKAINKLQKEKVKLIITVDGGIRNKEEVEYAKNLGLDIIITDHHIASDNKDELPDCLIINPILENEKYPFKYLAGVGAAFKLAKALISKSTLIQDHKKKLEFGILDLVAIGTVADCVSLLGENRILVKKGLEILNNTNRIGLKELINIAQINPVSSNQKSENGKNIKLPKRRAVNSRRLDTWNIGFQIAPRLNAAGRIDHANTAYQLLIAKNKNEAIRIAMRLNDKNIERQKMTNEIIESVEEQIKDDKSKIIIAVCPNDLKEPWNEGVIGLVAGRICKKYYKPTLIITRIGDKLKGSGRSIDEFNIIKSVEKCKEFLTRYGGHAAACGFSLQENNLKNFMAQIKKNADVELDKINLEPKIIVDAELALSEVDEDLIKYIEKFAPFGENNPRPKFVSHGAQIRDIATMGINGQHVKFKFAAGEVEPLRFDTNRRGSTSFWAVAFGQAEQWQWLKIGDKVDIVYYAEMNEFNGRREVQLKIVDIKFII